VAYEEKSIKDLVDTLIVNIEQGEQLFVDKFLSMTPLSGIPVWGTMLTKIAKFIFKTFIIPWGNDWIHWADVRFIHKADLEKRVKIFKEAPDEEFDEAFDNLIGVPKPK
jgi:hypothetical protein